MSTKKYRNKFLSENTNEKGNVVLFLFSSQSDYKGFSPSVDWDNVDWSSSPAIQAMPVTSAICSPPNGGAVKKGAKTTEVRGYAWSGGGNRIIRVDVTADGGRTWRAAEIIEQDAAREPRHYGWTLWKAEVEVPKGEKEMEVGKFGVACPEKEKHE